MKFKILFINAFPCKTNVNLALYALYALQGGFARCYELMEVSSGRMFAAKVISRAKLTKPQHRDKVIKCSNDEKVWLDNTVKAFWLGLP